MCSGIIAGAGEYAEFEFSRAEWEAISKLLQEHPLSQRSNLLGSVLEFQRLDRAVGGIEGRSQPLASVLIVRWITDPETGRAERKEAVIYDGKLVSIPDSNES